MAKQFKVPINLVGLPADPVSGSAGDVYFNTTTDVIKIYANSAWRDLSTYSGAVIVSTTAPIDPLEGQLWYDNDASQVFVYDGSYWVEIALGPQGPAGLGLPVGGTTNQFLIKSSNNNYETQWLTLPAKDLTSTDISNLTGTTGNVQNQIDALATDLGNTSTLYVELSDIGAINGVVGLNADQDAIIPGSSIIFEGVTANEYETILEVTDPTADRTITLPDISGTIITSASIGNGLDYDNSNKEIYVDPSEFALSSVGNPITDISMASYKITNLASPTSANDAANKAYVDNTTAGLNFHAPAQVATTANLSATYSNGTSGVGATLTSTSVGALTIDGYTPSTSDRVLVKNQSTGFQNGIYVVTNTGNVTNTWVLTRATDADNSPAGEVAYGDFIFIQNGTQNSGYGYTLNTTGTITIGTTSISYVQFNAGQTVIAGNGLYEPTPGTFTIDTSITADVSTAQTLTNKTINGANNTLTVRLANDVSGTLPVANGGTGITSFGTGIATFLGTPSSSNLASAITDETGSGALVFATGPTLTNSLQINPIIRGPEERWVVSATAATGTINLDISTSGILYYTSNASANWTLNIRGDSSNTLNNILAINDSITVVFFVTNGATPFYQTGFTIDGSSVTPKWQNASAPTSGNANSIDIYSYTIVKTANATFTAFGSQTRFA